MSRTFTSRATILLAMAIVFLASVQTCSSQASPAQAPAPASSSSDCMTSLLNMSDCLTFVEKGAKIAKPDKGCCPELAGLVESNPICLCQLLGNSNSIGIEIDLDRALKLPSVCKVETPPVSLCSAVGVPVGGPTTNEESMSPGASSPGGSNTLSPGGSSGPAAASENATPSSTARSTPALAILLGVAFASTRF